MLKTSKSKRCRRKKCGRVFKPYKTTDKYCSLNCARQDGGIKRIRPISKKRLKKLSGYSQIDLFNEIWEEREHISELSGDPLLPKGHPRWVHQFLHVLNKGRFSSKELEKKNILLGLPEEHDHQDRYEVFRQRKQELMAEVYVK